MISRAITVLILLVALSSPGSGQSSTIITSNATSTPSTILTIPSQSSQIITPSLASATLGLPSASASVNTTVPPTTPDETGTPTGPTTKPDETGTPTGLTTTPPEESRTCANLTVIVKRVWSETFTIKSSKTYIDFKTNLSTSLQSLYTKSESVKLTEVTIKKTVVTKQVLVSVTLCLVFKDGDLIEDMFINKVKSGELHGGIPVKNDSAEFEPIGVSFEDWKAKDGECKDKCDGAAGPINIERKCQAERYSCNGLKNKSDESDDCVKYCPSSNAAITVPSLILAIGIFLCFSFQ